LVIGINAHGLEVTFPVYASGRDMSLFYSLARSGAQRFMKKSENSGLLVRGLKRISFTVAEGDRLGIIGRNGSGKSTLLRTAAGYLKPAAGRLDVRGTVGTLIDLGIGVNGERSAKENVYFTGRLAGLNKEQIRALDEDVQSFADIGAFYHLPFDTYSSGMKLRVTFAMITHFRRDILIIDEVFGVGDAHFSERAYERMTGLVHKSKTMMLATHSENLLRQFCNKCMWLEDGQIRAMGEPDEVLRAYHAG